MCFVTLLKVRQCLYYWYSHSRLNSVWTDWLQDKGIAHRPNPLPAPNIDTMNGNHTIPAQRTPSPSFSPLLRQPKAEPDVLMDLDINTIDAENSLPQQRNPSPPCSPPFRQPKTEPDTNTLPIADTSVAEHGSNGPDAGEPSNVSISALEPEPDAGPSLFMYPSAAEDVNGGTMVVNSPELPLTPQKRSRELISAEVIDVDGISSDDEIVILEVRPSKVFLT